METTKTDQSDGEHPTSSSQLEVATPQPALTPHEHLTKAHNVLVDAIQHGEGNINAMQTAQTHIDEALALSKVSRLVRLSRRWGILIYIVMAGLAEVFFIELYCRWHGAYFISLDLYNPINIGILSNINFVNGPTTMSVAAEVLMWSSLGVWAKGTYDMARHYVAREMRYALDIGSYTGTMVRNTSVAAIVVIILRLTKFSIFGVALDTSSPLAFDATVGISFLLGFFGDDAYRILASFKDRIVKSIGAKEHEG